MARIASTNAWAWSGPRSSSIGTISGGSEMIRGSPSTRRVSLSKAFMLSLVRDFASSRSRRFFSALVAPASHSRLTSSASRRAYQMSSARI